MHFTVGAQVLMSGIAALAKAKGFEHAHVQARVNARGELVIAVLIPPSVPEEWGPPIPTLSEREARRLAPERRG
jgi:hypothetical protein